MKNIYSETFLKTFIIDLVDGVWSIDEFKEKFNCSEEYAKQQWKIITDLRTNYREN